MSAIAIKRAGMLLLGVLLVTAACTADRVSIDGTAVATQGMTEEPAEPTEPAVTPTDEPTDAPTATDEPTPTEAATDTAEPTPTEDAPDAEAGITAEDQPLGVDATVTVASVSAPEPGWVVIHADEDGEPGEILGFQPVDAGESTDVRVELDPTRLTGTLHAMLHVDAGEEGEFEFPGEDEPVTGEQGAIVMQPFDLTGNALGVEEQAPDETNAVNVPLVLAEQAGWLVIHADEDGEPGPVIGFAAVEEGLNTDVQVEIDVAQATRTVYAMLHVDTGVEGEFEFPDEDPPAEGAEGSPIVQPFTLTSISAAPGDSGGTASVSIQSISFLPGEITIPPGTTVTWSNDVSVLHTVTADDGTFDSGTMDQGAIFSWTFDEPGEYLYYCRFHGGPDGTGMSGIVIVEEG